MLINDVFLFNQCYNIMINNIIMNGLLIKSLFLYLVTEKGTVIIMEQQQTELILTMELSMSVRESMEYLVSNGYTDERIKDTVDAAKVLSKRYKNCDKDYQLYDKFSTNMSIRSNESYDSFIIWWDTLNDYIMLDICKIGKDLSTFSAEFAKTLLIFISNINMTNHPDNSPIFTFIQACGATLPEETFFAAMAYLTANPAALNGLIKDNSYIYSPDDAQVEFTECPICGGIGEAYFSSCSLVMPNFVRPYLPQKLWMKCNSCTNIYTRFFPAESLALADNHQMVQPQSQDATTAKVDTSILAIWCDIIKSMANNSDNKDKTLLEVGIGTRELLAVAFEMGYDVDTVEILESSAQMVANTLNLPIACEDFLKFTPDKKYAFIVMGDVLEHVVDPVAALNHAHSLLLDDGVIWLSTPNYESAFSRLNKFDDAMWKETQHLTYFSYKGLEDILYQCDFEVIDYSVSRRYNGSMELLLKKSMATPTAPTSTPNTTPTIHAI